MLFAASTDSAVKHLEQEETFDLVVAGSEGCGTAPGEAIDCISRLKSSRPKAPILFIGKMRDAVSVKDAQQAGAEACLHNRTPPAQLRAEILRLAQRGKLLRLFGVGGWAVFEQAVKGVEDLRCPLPGSDLDVTQMAQGTLAGAMTHTLIGNVLFSFGEVESQTGLRVRGQLAPGGMFFGIGLGPVRHHRFWGQEAPFGEARTILAANGGSRFEAVLEAGPIQYAGIAVPEEPFVESARSLAEQFPRIKSPKIFEISHAGRARLACAISKAAAAIRGAGTQPPKLHSDELSLELLTALIGSLDTARVLTRARRSIDIVARAEELVNESDFGLSIDELCIRLGQPRRALERAFRREFGTSPAHYAMMFRLCRAREELSRGLGSVTGVAAKFGFFELGRFAGRYRKVFGEYPSETLAASKSGLGVASLREPARLLWKAIH